MKSVASMCVVAGVFVVLRGHIDDPGVRGAIAWTSGPIAVGSLRAIVRRVRA